MNDFKVDDKVIMLDGRNGVIANKLSKFYYTVQTHDDVGDVTYFKMFYKDIKHSSQGGQA